MAAPIVAIGASCGGPGAIRELLRELPPDAPPILITVHMLKGSTRKFADCLNGECQLVVKEAEDGDRVLPGHVLIAPGDYHMTLDRSGGRYIVRLNRAPRVNWNRPSVDVMFHSVARCAGADTVGVILTGMGADGAQGLLAMSQAGASTIAQDESTSAIFGMPKQAIAIGAVDRVAPLQDIPTAILRRSTTDRGGGYEPTEKDHDIRSAGAV